MGNASRIAIFVPTLHGGGAERNMVNLAGGLAEMGRQVFLVAADAVGPFKDEVSPSVELIDLECPRVYASLFPLTRFLVEKNPDVLLTTMNHANLLAIFAGMATGEEIPIFVREANTLSKTAGNADSFRGVAVPLMAKWFYPRATKIIAPSTGVHNDLIEKFGMPAEKSVVIHNPVVDKKLYDRSSEEPSVDIFSDGVPVVLGCGSFTTQKDFPTLIRAFASVRAKRIARLAILGRGDLYDDYLRLISQLDLQDDVVFPGFVSNPFAFMSRAGVFVLSSRWEGLPNVPIQALACGCPVVSTDCPSGPSEILKAGEYGALTPVGNVDALASAIENALDNPLPRRKLRERAEAFTVETISQAYADLFDGALT